MDLDSESNFSELNNGNGKKQRKISRIVHFVPFTAWPGPPRGRRPWLTPAGRSARQSAGLQEANRRNECSLKAK